jgi:hypothetical protein
VVSTGSTTGKADRFDHRVGSGRVVSTSSTTEVDKLDHRELDRLDHLIAGLGGPDGLDPGKAGGVDVPTPTSAHFTRRIVSG